MAVVDPSFFARRNLLRAILDAPVPVLSIKA